MPLYEFVCKKCKHEFDEVCSYDDIGKVKCSKCKGKAEKKLSVPAIAFKGSGFYKTDSNSGSGYTASQDVVETAKKESFNKGNVTRRENCAHD